MSDMLVAVEPKSDQTNFDDFAAGQSRTIKITGAHVDATKEQKVTINYEGDNGKPYKPGKSMSRVLVHVWGDNSKNYIGKSLTLFGDPKVRFGGSEVGGVRISHMSHITEAAVVPLTVTRGKRMPYVVHPLVTGNEPTLADMIADIESAPNEEGLKHKYSQAVRTFKSDDDRKQIVAAKEKRKAELSAPQQA